MTNYLLNKMHKIRSDEQIIAIIWRCKYTKK